MNLYITFKIKSEPFCGGNSFTLRNSLYRVVKLTKFTDLDKYSYSGYGISFDVRGTFSLPNGGFGKNIILSGANMSLFAHVDDTKKIS